MTSIVELKTQIQTKVKQPLYIFTGEEIAVQDAYVKQIIKTFGLEAVRVDTVGEIFRKIQTKSFMVKPKCYIISNDQEYLKNEKVWGQLNSGAIQGEHVIILTYPTMDKRGKFYKQHQATLVEFEKMNDKILSEHVKREVELSNSNCEKLISICENNYSKILLEVDKIKQLASAKEVKPDTAFANILKENLIYIPTGDIIFELTDAICMRNIKKSYELWEKCKSFESPVKIVSILYNGFRSILLVQMAGTAPGVCERTGLTPWQVKLAKEKQGHFTCNELINIIKLLRWVEKGIKRGLIEAEIAVDFLLVHVLAGKMGVQDEIFKDVI